jgi:hypothetical protein
VVNVLSYATVAFQIAFPFCVALNARARRVMLAMAIGFHLGIAAFMGLVTFAAFMISADLLLVPDEDYQRIAMTLRRIGGWGKAIYLRRRTPPGQPSANP